MVLGFHWLGSIHQIKDMRHAFFTGFFGPIGVSAIFYLYISREFLRDMGGRPDAQVVSEAIEIVVWFLVICSIVVHGLSIPLAKLGLYLPRTLSTAISSERLSASQSRVPSESPDEGRLRQPAQSVDNILTRPFHRRPTTSERGPPLTSPTSMHWIPKSFVRAGKYIINDIRRPHGNAFRDNMEARAGEDEGSDGSGIADAHPEISRPMNARPIGHPIHETPSRIDPEDSEVRRVEEGLDPKEDGNHQSGSSSNVNSGVVTPATNRPFRSIQFADESVGSRRPDPDTSINE